MDDRVLRISPRQRCVWCHRLTDVAVGGPTGGTKSLLLDPGCWLHGYAETSPREERASIERFVVGYYHQQGQARVLKSAELSEIAGYQPDPVINPASHFYERAWRVRYTDTDGKRRTVFVIWSYERWTFVLRDPEKRNTAR
jgi:hypothetical protein